MRAYPDDLPIGPIDLVNCTCITSRDEIVPISILVNAVDVEVVPGIGTVVAGPSLARIDGKYGLVRLDVVETGPLKEESARSDVELWR